MTIHVYLYKMFCGFPAGENVNNVPVFFNDFLPVKPNTNLSLGGTLTANVAVLASLLSHICFPPSVRDQRNESNNNNMIRQHIDLPFTVN